MSFISDILSKIPGIGDGKEDELKGPEDQSADEIDLAGFVKHKVEECRGNANRISHEGIWMTNIAYILGFDNVYYDTAAKSFRPVAKASQYLKRNRVHQNLILPAVQNRLARLCKVPPRFDVRPNGPDTDEREAARLGIEVLTMLWEKCRMGEKRLELGMWLQECGHSYLKVSYDCEAGEELTDPETGECIGYEGDIRVDVVSAFEVFADPLATCLRDASWVAHCKVRKLDYFRTHYPERGHLVKEEGPWLLSTQYQLRINSLNATGPTMSGTTEQMKHAAIEISYYESRSEKHPTGRHVVVANGVVLEDKDLPVGRFPLVKFDDILVAGKFYAEASITHARPLQDQYNRTLGRRAEWVNKLLAGKYIAAKGHGLSDESFNDQSGEILEYNPVPGGTEPHAVQVPQLPEYAYQETTQLEKGIYDAFGLSEVSRGIMPSAGIPAVGMQLLLEQDETRVGIEVEQHEHAFAEFGELLLRYAGEYYKTERKLKSKGKNLEYQIKYFKGDDLKKAYDVSVVKGSMVPTSKYLRRQEILNAFNGGLLGNPQDPAVKERILGMLEFGDIGEIYKDHSLDMAQIKRTLEMIEASVVPDVSELDNHALHIQEKDRYRKSEKFLKLAPNLQALLLADIENHLQYLIERANPNLAFAPGGTKYNPNGPNPTDPPPPPPIPTTPGPATGLPQPAGAPTVAPPQPGGDGPRPLRQAAAR